jgi:hypothetical protein
MVKYFPNYLEYPIHMEGWVLLTKLNDGNYDYSKIKTNLYYKCHKIKDKNIDELLKLPKTCRIYYPILGILNDFFTNSRSLLHTSIHSIYDLLLKNVSKDSAFYISLNEKVKKRTDLYFEDPSVIQNKELVFKIFINNFRH